MQREDGKTYCLDTGNTNAIEIVERQIIQLNDSKEFGNQPKQQNRIYDENGLSPCVVTKGGDNLKILQRKRGYNNGGEVAKEGKSPTLTSFAFEQNNVIQTKTKIRKLTPRECGRLQTVPEEVLDKMLSSGVSDTQLYKMFGNGWTIDVISHIFSYIK